MMSSGEETHCPGDDVFFEAPLGFESYVWLKDGNALENSGNIIQIVSDGAYRLIAWPVRVTPSVVGQAVCQGSRLSR